MIIKEVESLYKFAGHDVTKEQIIEIASLIVDKYQITEKQFHDFINECKLGSFGVIYKNPTSLMMQIKSFFALKHPLDPEAVPGYDGWGRKLTGYNE